MAGQVPHKLHAILLSKKDMPVNLHGLVSQQLTGHGKDQPLSGAIDQLNEGPSRCNATCMRRSLAFHFGGNSK
jgi:ferric iron reductase protein FhuF